jgi:hypothetical protein
VSLVADDRVDSGESAAHPLVSICLRNYNYAQFLPQAIDSALDQTYEHVEVLVLDDGSTDRSDEVLRAYEHRVRVVRQDNAGAYGAALAVFRASNGSIVIFLDADDRIHRDTVTRVVNAFARHPDAGRVQWRLDIVTEDGGPTVDMVPPNHWAMPEGDLREHVLRRRTYVWPPTSGNAFLRRTIDLVFECLEPVHRCGDVDLFFAEATPVIGPVVNLVGTGGDYRWHGGNDSARVRKEPVRFLHDRIEEIIVAQDMLVGLGSTLGFAVDPDPRTALDWAFAGYRLGSLRLDPEHHPFPDDRPLRVAAHGIRSVIGQPDYGWRARVLRVGWFVTTALAPRAMAGRLVERAFLGPPSDIVPRDGPTDEVSTR